MKLEDQLRDTMRFKHLSLKTEESYVGWYRRYVLWHGKKHPAEMGAEEVEAFLTHLAVERKLAASSQNQRNDARHFWWHFYPEAPDTSGLRWAGCARLFHPAPCSLMPSPDGAAGRLLRFFYPWRPRAEKVEISRRQLWSTCHQLQSWQRVLWV